MNLYNHRSGTFIPPVNVRSVLIALLLFYFLTFECLNIINNLSKLLVYGHLRDMSDGWKFSPTSNQSIKDLKDQSSVLQERETRNKWLDKFKTCYKEDPIGITVYNPKPSENQAKTEDAEANMPAKPKPNLNPLDAFYQSIESEPIARFDFMLEEGSRNTLLFKILAERLSGQAVERICKHMFDSKDLKMLHIDNFFRYFFPIFLRRGYSWFSLDIMVKANKLYPNEFRNLLQILLRDTEISNTMINDFVLTLDETGKYEFLTMVIELELTNEELIHNLISITSAYKNAEKSELVQNYIYNSLVQLSANCLSDWNYGRLLLSYLHSISKGQVNFDIRMVERLIDMHRSPFKRPCMSVLNEAIKALSEAAIPPNPS